MTGDRLLVIDDEPEIGDFVVRVAKLAGYDALAVTEAAEFRKLVADWAPSHIVLDLMVPDVDGIELFRFLADRKSRARIIVMSGVDPSILEASKRLGDARGLDIVATVAKPVRASELGNLLRRVKTNGVWLTVAELVRAINDKELFLVYQPKIALASRKVVGFESLVRWQHPKRGVVPPVEFIPFAEENDVIDQVTRSVLGGALDQLRAWKEQGIEIELSVNVSGKNLHDLNFADDLLRLCEHVRVSPGCLTLELTETAVAKDAIRAMDILTRLRLHGVKLSIDDFGTGYSSLVQLQSLPFSEVKIDKAVTAEIGATDSSSVIAKTIIDMAHNLRMQVVAEGVESEKILATLGGMGCDLAQGYHIARPLAVDRVLPWMQDWAKTASA